MALQQCSLVESWEPISDIEDRVKDTTCYAAKSPQWLKNRAVHAVRGSHTARRPAAFKLNFCSVAPASHQFGSSLVSHLEAQALATTAARFADVGKTTCMLGNLQNMANPMAVSCRAMGKQIAPLWLMVFRIKLDFLQTTGVCQPQEGPSPETRGELWL